LKESAATAPPPRRDRHGGSGRGSGSAAMDISGPFDMDWLPYRWV